VWKPRAPAGDCRGHPHWSSEGTVILGALSVLERAFRRRRAITWRHLKGNVSRKGERIYHLAGGLDYVKISMARPPSADAALRMKPKRGLAAGKTLSIRRAASAALLAESGEIQAKPGGHLESERRSPKVSAGLSPSRSSSPAWLCSPQYTALRRACAGSPLIGV